MEGAVPTTTEEQAGDEKYDFFAHNAIIPQPSLQDVRKQTTVTLLIDSRDRDFVTYPDANSYVVSLPDEYTDVISLELLNYDVPTQQYTIRDTNRQLHYGVAHPTLTLEEDGTGNVRIDYDKAGYLTIDIDQGYYEEFAEDDLGQNIEEKLNLMGASSYRVTYDRKLNKFTISTDFSDRFDADGVAFFQLFFEGQSSCYMKRSVGPILGFDKKDPDTLLEGYIEMSTDDPRILVGTRTSFTSRLVEGDWLYILDLEDNTRRYRAQVINVVSNTQVLMDRPLTIRRSLCWVGRIVAPWVRNINPDPYIIMKINGIDTIASTNNNVNRCFTYIPTRKHNFEIRDNLTSIKYFNPIMWRLDRLHLRFLNYDGSLYDFNGLDHVLIFRVVRFKQNINYVEFGTS
jgi:hypothetical protein